MDKSIIGPSAESFDQDGEIIYVVDKWEAYKSTGNGKKLVLVTPDFEDTFNKP